MRGLMAFDETYDEPEYTEVLVKSLDPGHPVELRYAHAGDAGADLVAAEDVTLKPFQRALVPTGMAIALGKYGQLYGFLQQIGRAHV